MHHGVTLGGLIEDALRVYFASSDKRAAKPFRLRTVSGRLVDPHLDLDRTSALITMDDEAAYSRRRRR